MDEDDYDIYDPDDTEDQMDFDNDDAYDDGDETTMAHAPLPAGLVLQSGPRCLMITGSIWWNVERHFAYYYINLNSDYQPYGNPVYAFDGRSMENLPKLGYYEDLVKAA